MANISSIKLPSGNTYDIKDNSAMPISGGTFTGPVTFGDSMTAPDANVGDLVVTGAASFANNAQFNTINGVTVGSSPKFTDTNYYHTSGSWSGLTYTATANGGAGALALTLPTGTSATTVALGNHTHTASLAADTGTSTVTLASAGKYKLTAGGSSVIFTMPTIPTVSYPVTSVNTKTGAVTLSAADVGAVALTGNETVAGNKTFSGTTTLAAGSIYTVGANTKITVNAGALIQSPIPKYLWHDLFAFSYKVTPTYYVSADNSTWTTATLDKRPFAQKENFSYQIIKTTGQTGSRWVWNSSAFHYSNGLWLVIGVAYAATLATATITFDVSTDGSTWTTKYTGTHSASSSPIWCYVNGGIANTPYLRLTITKDTSDTTGVFNINAIKLLSYRWGDQGGGSEYEYPYTWDENKNITFSAKTTSDSFQTSKLYIPTSSGGSTYGAGTSGQVLKTNGTTVYWGADSAPTSATSHTTGITASTTATKTTLGTAFTIPNVTAAGSASSWTFEEKSIPNVTAAGSGSFTSGAFSGGSGSFSATVSNHVLSYSHTHTAATHGADSHTHTAPTIGTAIKVQSKSGGSNGSAPTLGTAFTVPNVTGNTSATVSITDSGHTHTLS